MAGDFDEDGFCRVCDNDLSGCECDDTFLDYHCGMGTDGQCSMAGTEDCDWDCPRMKSKKHFDIDTCIDFIGLTQSQPARYDIKHCLAMASFYANRQSGKSAAFWRREARRIAAGKQGVLM